MAKTPEKPKQGQKALTEDEILRRMLNTPHKPHKANGGQKKPAKE